MTDEIILDSNVLALEVLHRVFDKVDTDRNKRISIAELTKALVDLRFENASVVAANVMTQGDADGSGDLDFDEFANVMSQLEESGLTASFGLLFHGFDKDGDGTIDDEEFAAMFRFLRVDVSSTERKRLFKNADSDGDGRIDPIEAMEALAHL